MQESYAEYLEMYVEMTDTKKRARYWARTRL